MDDWSDSAGPGGFQAFESDTFSQQKLGRDKRLGKVDWEKLNVSGGSIALGHPFAATRRHNG